MNYDIIALGEMVIDFTETGFSPQGNALLEVNPGGAPCNVLSMATNLGEKCAFIGKVGDDDFGVLLRNAIKKQGIDDKYLYIDKEVHTTLAFVHTAEDGDRSFSFYRNPGADMMLNESEIPVDAIKTSKVFHFGSLSMTHEGVYNATKKALDTARDAGCVITYDPNLRPPLWDSLDHAKEMIAFGMGYCDVLKISDDEILWFTDKDNYDDAISYLQDTYPNIKLITLSLGKEGSRAYYNNERVDCAPVLNENTIETTGAGDTFFACVIHFINKYGLDNFDKEKLYEMLKCANSASSIITTRKGALSVMPTKNEVLETVAKNF